MDSYLEIARTVLKNARQPLSARQILKTADQLQLLPRELYGRTQHKTLQARLATDILKHRSKSEFYRTGPGRFFLRLFLADRAIPSRHRQEYHAPLRTAQLGKFDVVAFPRPAIEELARKVRSPFPLSKLFPLPWQFARLYNLRREDKLLPFRFHLLLLANDKIFVDNGRPSSTEGDMVNRSVIGIEGFVKWGDQSLFSSDGFGLMDAATRILFERFELPRHVRPVLEDLARWSHPQTVVDHDANSPGVSDFVVYLSFKCADVAELIEAIDAQVATEWLPIPIKLNDVGRFSKWSARLITDARLQARLWA